MLKFRSRISATVFFLSVLACVSGCGASVQQPVCPTCTECAPSAEATPAPASPSQDDGVRDDGTVRLEGTAEVPAELRARLSQYLETRSATADDISPDGRSVLTTTRFGNTPQLHVVRHPLGARHQITFGEEPTRGAAFYPNDSNLVLLREDVGGAENYQLFRLDLQSGQKTLVTDGRSRNAEFLFSKDGGTLYYVSNARNGTDMDVWRSDGQSVGELFLERSGDWQFLDVSRDGRILLLLEYISITNQRIHWIDTQTKESHLVSPDEAGADRSALLSSDGRSAFVVSDRGGEFSQLYQVSLGGERSFASWRPLTAEIPWNVEEMVSSADGRTVVFTTNADGYSDLYLLNVRNGRVSPVVGSFRGVISGLRSASNAPQVAFSATTPTMSGDVFTLDLRSKQMTRWTQSELGGLQESHFVEPELIRYTSFDGREIPAFYYPARTPRAQRIPVVINIHGGPEAQSRPWFSPFVQFLAAEAGIAVIVPNVRGSDGYGRTYLSMDDGRKREDSVRDIGSLLDWIGTRPGLDSGRVAVYGGSYGGYMVLASLVHFGERLRAGVDVVGIANFVTFLEQTAPYRRELRRVEYGDESNAEMRQFLTEISPVAHVDRIRSALFVAHGANDPRVPAAEAEQIVQRVREQGADVWYMLARNEGHGFSRKENRDLFTQLSILFLEQHLLH